MKDGDVWSLEKWRLSVFFSFYLDILRVDSPATDFIFRFSICLVNVVISRIDYDLFIFNKSFSVYLAVASCQNIFFVDDDTTAVTSKYPICIIKPFKIYWRMFRNKIRKWLIRSGI